MLKIKQIKLENFRGIRQPLTIDFVKGGKFTSVAILGRNGTGKSSIADGWEWFNTFNIAALKREGVSPKDFHHRACDGTNVYVEATFQHSDFSTINVAYNPDRITQPKITGELDKYKPYCVYPNYLRFADLQDFVYRTKTEKYQYIAKYFGLEAFTKSQAELLAFVNRLNAKYDECDRAYLTAKSTIEKLLKKESFEEADIIAALQTIADRHGLVAVSTFADSKRIKEKLAETIGSNPRTKELLEWRQLRGKGQQLYPITGQLERILRLETLFKELKSDAEQIAKLVLLGLYETSIEVLRAKDDKTICPVCDARFDGDLLMHVQNKHSHLESLAKKKTEFEQLQRLLIDYFNGLSSKAQAFICDLGDSSNEEYGLLVEDLRQTVRQIPEVLAILHKGITDIDELKLSSLGLTQNIQRISNAISWFEVLVGEQIIRLETDEQAKNLAADHELVLGLLKEYFTFLVADKKRAHIRELHSEAEQMLELITAFLQDSINAMFGEIAADVAEYFNELEKSHNIFKNPLLRLVTGKEKAVELEIEFGSEVVKPAYKVLSESQINSFGLAIFLASVRRFNCDFKFFILDDVVNSFDNHKRPRVASLLKNKFKDFQILMLTHDDVFFETLQRHMTEWNRIRFTGWDYSTGPTYTVAKNILEEVQSELDKDRPIVAGMQLGRYLEWTMGELCENLKAAVPFKRLGDYTLSDLYLPFSKKAKDCVKEANKIHQLQTLLEHLDTQTIFRNYCAHWKSESSPFSTPEIQEVLDCWLNIEKLIYSPACGSFVRAFEANNKKYLMCSCATLKLNGEFNYTALN